MKRGKENLKKDNSNLHRCIHTRMDDNSNRVKKTGKMYIQNIHYAPFVEHLYIQPWATSPSCPTQTKGNKMSKKKDRIIEINIDKWEIHIPKHTHKELSTALIVLACNFKDSIAEEAVADLKMTNGKLLELEKLKEKLCK